MDSSNIVHKTEYIHIDSTVTMSINKIWYFSFAQSIIVKVQLEDDRQVPKYCNLS